VEIRDGGTMYSDSIDKLCSKRIPDTKKTSGNMAYIVFMTDISEPKNGFKANVSIGDAISYIYFNSVHCN
jgi:cubilin